LAVAAEQLNDAADSPRAASASASAARRGLTNNCLDVSKIDCIRIKSGTPRAAKCPKNKLQTHNFFLRGAPQKKCRYIFKYF
jgi:hypothetical protein